MASDNDSERGERRHTERAISLHESVSPDRWCVNWADLKYLKQEVRQAIKNGEITPPDDGSDDFLGTAENYGPSIYTVTDQHIKPITQRAGKMSWALMRHPEGLDCDVFISHAWQEGIFEFLSKVLHSRPRHARHAWCCMLANPQHLDIAAMLQSPRHSPFAVALEASTTVLVVPNRLCSVYTRLWCAYEAYLAQEQGKIILIARASNWRRVCNAMWYMALAAFVGSALAVLLDFQGWTRYVNLGVTCVAAIAGVGSMVTAKNTLRVALNFIGEVMCWYLVVEWDTVGGLYSRHPSPFLDYVAAVTQRAWIVCLAATFFLLEVDRINSEVTGWEAQQLARGYTGSIVHATCSRPEDDEAIRREIGGTVEAVDYAIQVLMSAGMSTPTLREVAARGVCIHQAANPAIALPMLLLGPFLMLTFVTLIFDSIYLRDSNPEWFARLLPLRATTVLQRVIMLLKIRCSPRDERCYIYLVIQKCATVYLAFITPAMVKCQLNGYLSYDSTSTWFLIPPIAYSTMLAFVMLGFRRTANLPCGLYLLQMFLARGFRTLFMTTTGCGAPPNEDSESDSESEIGTDTS
ncbi:unnamed protein product [Symbiodinium natans]|uniref:Transmembrane protein n=1 Tax=Symbiodinium natans TaxID=878477 RepID=A0A812LZW7_9DINO|nr:unnamed protein product [Symbiodinium natans]